MSSVNVRDHYNNLLQPKRGYSTREQAYEAAALQQRGNRSGRAYHAYRCPLCHRWHVGRGSR